MKKKSLTPVLSFQAGDIPGSDEDLLNASVLGEQTLTISSAEDGTPVGSCEVIWLELADEKVVPAFVKGCTPNEVKKLKNDPRWSHCCVKPGGVQ